MMDRSDEIMSMSALLSSLRAAGRHHLSAGTFVVRPVTGSYLFRIEQFKRIQKMLGNGTMIESGTFRVGGHDWRIKCYPNGEKGHEGFIALYLVHASPDRTSDATADFCMSILDRTGEAISWSDGEAQVPEEIDDETQGDAQNFSFRDDGIRCGWREFMKVEDLDHEEHLKDGCLRILCDVTVLDMRTTDYRDGMASMTTMARPSELHRQLTEVLSESKESADLEIEVGGVTFPANTSMLAARPPVFKEELMPTKIRVEGIDADVFKALLHFIHTDTLPQEIEQQETLAKMAKPLLVAVDRYKLEKLKLICEEALCGQIDMDSVATTLEFAEQHCCSVLKEACTQFLADFSF